MAILGSPFAQVIGVSSLAHYYYLRGVDITGPVAPTKPVQKLLR